MQRALWASWETRCSYVTILHESSSLPKKKTQKNQPSVLLTAPFKVAITHPRGLPFKQFFSRGHTLPSCMGFCRLILSWKICK